MLITLYFRRRKKKRQISALLIIWIQARHQFFWCFQQLSNKIKPGLKFISKFNSLKSHNEENLSKLQAAYDLLSIPHAHSFRLKLLRKYRHIFCVIIPFEYFEVEISPWKFKKILKKLQKIQKQLKKTDFTQPCVPK